MEFKDIVYEARREKGLSQDQLAQQCNVSRQAISKWENGSANPDLTNLKQLSKVLDMSVDALLGKSIQDQQRYSYAKHTKEYKSKAQVFGIPLIHVNVGRGRHVAKGIIAIGNISIGVIAIGFMSAGILSFGILTLGLLFALGVLALSYLSVGALAIGYIAIGAMAIGAYSIGALSIGYVLSIGSLSYGTTAIGPMHSTYGEVSYFIRSAQDCIIGDTSFQELQRFIQDHQFPNIIRLMLEHFTKC